VCLVFSHLRAVCVKVESFHLLYLPSMLTISYVYGAKEPDDYDSMLTICRLA